MTWLLLRHSLFCDYRFVTAQRTIDDLPSVKEQQFIRLMVAVESGSAVWQITFREAGITERILRNQTFQMSVKVDRQLCTAVVKEVKRNGGLKFTIRATKITRPRSSKPSWLDTVKRPLRRYCSGGNRSRILSGPICIRIFRVAAPISVISVVLHLGSLLLSSIVLFLSSDRPEARFCRLPLLINSNQVCQTPLLLIVDKYFLTNSIGPCDGRVLATSIWLCSLEISSTLSYDHPQPPTQRVRAK